MKKDANTRRREAEVTLCHVPPMRLFLVAGCHPVDRPKRWRLATSPDGPTTTSLRKACLFSFSPKWVEVARGAARTIRQSLRGNWQHFVARVLVAGDPENPTEVVAAWTLEGQDEPSHVEYFFD